MAYTAAKAPTNPAGPAPLRRPGSIRRTSSIDTQWPEGMGKPMRMQGRARDLITLPNGQAHGVADDQTDILVSPTRQILSIETDRRNDVAQQFVGARGGGHLRGEITRVMPDEQAEATTLNLLLDDISGASLVAGWAWSRWTTDWNAKMRQAASEAVGADPAPRRMEGICSGFRPGGTSLNPDGTASQVGQNATVVPPLPNPDDPLSWHAFPETTGVAMRRARRIDVWFDGGFLKADVGFQDSSTSPSGPNERIAVHEYRVEIIADPETFELLSILVDPRILPYRECPGASPNAALLIGSDLQSFRLKVPEVLPGIMGCTHLNDVLRSLTDAPKLARRLKRELEQAPAVGAG